MPPAIPLIALLTDFGTKDYFVASMKGVILTIHPAARIVDISHDIGPHQIAEAAYCLQACYRTFPEGTVHVAVVDPGVGSHRRPILVATDRYYFVAPDNGVLTPIIDREAHVEIREIENRQYRLPSPGATFHGRDVFAPAAAWLATGAMLSSFGRLVSDPVRMNWPQPKVTARTIIGEIVYIDRFGNLISNISHAQIETCETGRPGILVEGHPIGNLVANYREGQADALHAVINSNGMLELFLKERPASEYLKIGLGTVVEIPCRR
ncbi:MAG: SAM-dependent chlorinase/fluorinase [Nitrospira sp.]|nr:SAM-dependent chlorinase/fluorinase [Nitrospira sp.]